MKENKFNEMSYNKSLQNRRTIRKDLFQRNRQIQTLSYLSSYPIEIRQVIMNSIEGIIPSSLPPSSQAVRSTISYYRRQNLPVFKTRQQGCVQLDPHMVYESLWSLSKIDISFYPQEVIMEFEADLHLYLKMPFQQVRQLAVIAAGNKILGKPQQILEMMGLDEKNVWVMINHVYERKVDFKYMFQYIQKDVIIIYRAIFELTNNYKEDIIYPLVSSQQILTKIIENFGSQNSEIQDFSIRIIGNILAQIEDYAGDLTRYQLLDHTYPLLINQKWEIKRNGCWLLANYAFGQGGANEMLNKTMMMERLMIIFKKQTKIDLRVEVYYILSHLALYGKKENVYKWSLQQNLLQICAEDLQIEDQNLITLTLNFIEKLIDIGDEFMDIYDGTVNPFSHYISSTNLKTLISKASFSQNQEISQLSLAILDKINVEGTDYGMEI